MSYRRWFTDTFIWPLVFVLTRIYFFLLELSFNTYHFFFTRKIVVPAPQDELLKISANQAVKLISKRELTSTELVEAYIRRIEQINHIINAVVVKNFEEALLEARDLDMRLADMDEDELEEYIAVHPLCGVPFTMKDAMQVEGKVITCGIYNRKNTVCEKTAEVVLRMKAAGGILLAITNVPEVCLWVESNNNIYGRSCNPYDNRRMVGGSSGGEGALIAAAGSLVGIGSDIGGSIRMPCFFNGIFGMKSTPGVIPLEGHIPSASGYKSQMLRIGPMCRFASDLPLLLKIMGGEAAIPLNVDERVPMGKLRIFYMEGIPENPFIQPLSNEMRQSLKRAVLYFVRKYDLVAHRIDLPLVKHTMEFFLTSMEAMEGEPKMANYMLSAEGDKGKVNCFKELPKFVMGKSNHTLAAIVAGLLDEVPTMSEQTKKEFICKRDLLARQIKELLGNDGIFLFPSWPCTALFHNQPILTPINFGYTALFNSLALPAVQCPMGLDKNGLPLGVQIVGSPNSDRLLVSAAMDLEEGFGGWVKPGTPVY